MKENKKGENERQPQWMKRCLSESLCIFYIYVLETRPNDINVMSIVEIFCTSNRCIRSNQFICRQAPTHNVSKRRQVTEHDKQWNKSQTSLVIYLANLKFCRCDNQTYRCSIKEIISNGTFYPMSSAHWAPEHSRLSYIFHVSRMSFATLSRVSVINL